MAWSLYPIFRSTKSVPPRAPVPRRCRPGTGSKSKHTHSCVSVTDRFQENAASQPLTSKHNVSKVPPITSLPAWRCLIRECVCLSRWAPTSSFGTCSGFAFVDFLIIHIEKAAGSSVECTLNDASPLWVLSRAEVRALRPGVKFLGMGNHATFEDFVNGVPGLPAKAEQSPVRHCSHRNWEPGGANCLHAPVSRAFLDSRTYTSRVRVPSSRVCTPLITFVQHPVDRFLSSFYQVFGQNNSRGRTCGMLSCQANTELSKRYMSGNITPDEFARWEPDSTIAASWNTATKMIGGDLHRYITSSGYVLLPNTSLGQQTATRAKERLHKMDFVGLAYRFHDSMVLLSWWLGLPSLNITCVANAQPPWQASQKGGKHDPRMKLSKQGVAAILKQNQLDLELYHEAVMIWEARWDAMQRASTFSVQQRYFCRDMKEEDCSNVSISPLSPLMSSMQKCSTSCQLSEHTHKPSLEHPISTRL